jgi:hypothetical protein
MCGVQRVFALHWLPVVLFRAIARIDTSFAVHCLAFVDQNPFTKKEEDIVMSNNNNKIIRSAIAVLAFPKVVALVIVFVGNIVQKMTGNAYFPSPVPTLAVLVAALNELHDAEKAALSRAKGAAALRNAKLAAVRQLTQQMRAYVQSVADAAPENSAAIIESGGFAVRKVNPRGKRAFVIKPGALAGSVIVTAVAAGPRSSYEWQYSIDGGKTWINLPATIQSKTTISGLPSGTMVMVRYLVVTAKGGQGDWALPTSLQVK